MARRFGFFLLVLLTLLAPSAFAQRGKTAPPAPPTAADVETAEALYAKLDYEGANAVAERVVRKNGLSHDQLVRAYRVLAVTYAVVDKEEQARDAFLQLLTYDPEYQADPNLGPKVNTPFMEARGSFRSLSSRPGIDVSAAISTGGGTLRVTTRDPTHIVKRVNVGYRWTSSGDYTVSQVSPNDPASAVEVASPPAGRTRLDFYVQALDDRDNAVLEAGNPNVPKSAFAEAGAKGGGGGAIVVGGGGSKDKDKDSGGIFSSPVFWVVVGVVVVGGGTAAYFAARPSGPPQHALLSPSIQCGTDKCN